MPRSRATSGPPAASIASSVRPTPRRASARMAAAPGLHLAAVAHRLPVEPLGFFDRLQGGVVVVDGELGTGKMARARLREKTSPSSLGQLAVAAREREPPSRSPRELLSIAWVPRIQLSVSGSPISVGSCSARVEQRSASSYSPRSLRTIDLPMWAQATGFPITMPAPTWGRRRTAREPRRARSKPSKSPRAEARIGRRATRIATRRCRSPDSSARRDRLDRPRRSIACSGPAGPGAGGHFSSASAPGRRSAPRSPRPPGPAAFLVGVHSRAARRNRAAGCGR